MIDILRKLIYTVYKVRQSYMEDPGLPDQADDVCKTGKPDVSAFRFFSEGDFPLVHAATRFPGES